MYPRLSDLIIDLFGVSLPFDIYSFGAMVAVAILTASWITGREIDRMYRAGLVPGVRVSTKQDKRKKTEEVKPSVIMGAVTVIAVFGGFFGAKFFHILENLDQFVLDPFGSIFSTGGFTFYGGLIVAALGIAWYVRKKGIPVLRFTDAAAPSLMLAYGIGRIGCHLAGDGDWGITSNVAAKPGWLPTWLWAEVYPNNILTGAPLPNPVYPTSIYEFVAGVLLFALLWAVRKHPYRAGWLFSLYLVLNGVERFLIEQIRVNNTYDLLGFNVTQAEVIALVLVVIGVIGLALTTRRAATPAPAVDVAN